MDDEVRKECGDVEHGGSRGHLEGYYMVFIVAL